jgi:hypothetical protein
VRLEWSDKKIKRIIKLFFKKKNSVPNVDKPWSLNLNQSNIEGWNWKNNFNYTKGLKTIATKEWGSK